jgi:hypothetical protein
MGTEKQEGEGEMKDFPDINFMLEECKRAIRHQSVEIKKPTPEQIEKYIKYADLEMGPECCEDWVEQVRRYLRRWAYV